MLRVRDLHLDYAGVVALRGANGAGKSSLLAAVSGLHRPVKGSIEFLGRQISRLPAHQVARLGAVLVPEGRRLFAQQTVLQNLMLGAYQRPHAERAADLRRAYELFPVLAERAEQHAGTLSGGEQQMVALGRAFMSRPRLL